MQGANLMKVLIPLIVPLIFYGCFGNDNNSSTSLSGTVADGYIENATVCFDENGNLTCDDSEPTTTTAADGSYSITASGSVEGLAVIAVVGPDSKDADDNGQTMAEAGKEGFNFNFQLTRYITTMTCKTYFSSNNRF